MADEEIPTLSYRPVKRDGAEHVAGGEWPTEWPKEQMQIPPEGISSEGPGPMVRYPETKDVEAAKKLAREMLENMKAGSLILLPSGFQIEYIGADEFDEPTIVPAPKD